MYRHQPRARSQSRHHPRLPGITRQLPAGCGGVVAALAAPSASAGAEERAWVSAATFGGLTYWNHDAAPAASDWQARCVDWLVLAEKVGCGCLRAALAAALLAGCGAWADGRGAWRCGCREWVRELAGFKSL